MQDILFQQDNSLVHWAYNLMALLERNCIEVEEYPPYSHDLNPVMWVEIKKQLQQQYPRFGNTLGGKEVVRRRLAHVLPLVWETILKEFFEKLWKSMPDRIAVVLKAREGYTKY